jgi:hypothetical protein
VGPRNPVQREIIEDDYFDAMAPMMQDLGSGNDHMQWGGMSTCSMMQ